MHANVAARPFVWDKVYPGVPTSPVIAVTVPDNRFTLEGRVLGVVEVGHTDTEATSVLHVPDLAPVVAGDVIYNRAHLYLSESSLAGLDKWHREERHQLLQRDGRTLPGPTRTHGPLGYGSSKAFNQAAELLPTVQAGNR